MYGLFVRVVTRIGAQVALQQNLILQASMSSVSNCTGKEQTKELFLLIKIRTLLFDVMSTTNQLRKKYFDFLL